MRRLYPRAFIAISVVIGIFLYIQVVILTVDHSRGQVHLQIEQEVDKLRPVSKPTPDVRVLKLDEGHSNGRENTQTNLKLDIIRPSTHRHDDVSISRVNITSTVLQETKRAFDDLVIKHFGINGARLADVGQKDKMNVSESEKTSPLKFWEHKFLTDYEKGLDSGWTPSLWQEDLYNRTKSRSPPKRSFFLSHLLMIRLYTTDLARWTLRELKQWMHYMFLIGIEHIYICDHFHPGDEDMEQQLQQYIALGLVSYCRITTPHAMSAQVECYKKWIKAEGGKSKWMTSIDMDEYPYHMKDQDEYFLHRFLKSIQQDHPDVAELAMHNFLMLGQGDRTKNMTVDRIRRSTPGPANKLMKPIFMPEFCSPDIHHCFLKGKKRRMAVHPKTLRMLHYWGSRLQNWGPDTNKVIDMTVPFSDMADTWVERIRTSLLMFGEEDAFSSETGP